MRLERPAPLFAQHSREVLQDFGIEPQRIERLVETGIVVDRGGGRARLSSHTRRRSRSDGQTGGSNPAPRGIKPHRSRPSLRRKAWKSLRPFAERRLMHDSVVGGEIRSLILRAVERYPKPERRQLQHRHCLRLVFAAGAGGEGRRCDPPQPGFLSLVDAVHPIQRLTLGGICIYRSARDLMERKMGRRNVISEQLNSTSIATDGRVRFPRNLHREVYSTIIDAARRLRPDLEIALCLEEETLWESTGLAGNIGHCNCGL